MKNKFALAAIVMIVLMALAACQNGVQEVQGDVDATVTSAQLEKPAAPSAVTKYAAPNAASGYFTFTGVEGAGYYQIYWRYADQNKADSLSSGDWMGAQVTSPTSVVNYTTYAGATKAPDNTFYVRINTFPGTAVGVDAIAAQNVQFGVQAYSFNYQKSSEISWGPAIANK